MYLQVPIAKRSVSVVKPLFYFTCAQHVLSYPLAFSTTFTFLSNNLAKPCWMPYLKYPSTQLLQYYSQWSAHVEPTMYVCEALSFFIHIYLDLLWKLDKTTWTYSTLNRYKSSWPSILGTFALCYTCFSCKAKIS